MPSRTAQHRPASARSLAGILTTAALLAAPAAAASLGESRSRCLAHQLPELVSAASCGDGISLRYCLGTLPPDSALDLAATPDLLSSLASCFLDAGCTSDESRIEAAWTLRRCDTPAELRRRDPAPTPAPAPAANGDPDASSGNACLVTSTSSTSHCPVQSTGANRGHHLPCVPTTAAWTDCAPGMVCFYKTDEGTDDSSSSSGSSDDVADVWCRRDNGVPPAGIAVALVFAAVSAAAVGAIIFSRCRERRRDRDFAAKAEAEAARREARRYTIAAAAATNKEAAEMADGPYESYLGGAPPVVPRRPSRANVADLGDIGAAAPYGLVPRERSAPGAGLRRHQSNDQDPFVDPYPNQI